MSLIDLFLVFNVILECMSTKELAILIVITEFSFLLGFILGYKSKWKN